MDYVGEDTEYYNNCNTYYDGNCNEYITYDPAYNNREYYSVNPSRNPEMYQYDEGIYTNENYYDSKAEQPFNVKGYPNYLEDYIYPSHVMNPENYKTSNGLYAVVEPNGFNTRENIPLQNRENRRVYRNGNSRKSNQSHSVHSSSIPSQDNRLNVQINGRKIPKSQRRIIRSDEREESEINWLTESTNTDKITEDTNSYIYEQEEEQENIQHIETAENGRTMIININCNNNNNIKHVDVSENSDDASEDSDEEFKKGLSKKPIKPKKIFMGKYLFSDIKKSFMYPLTVCAPHPTLIAPNPGCWHYKIIPKYRREKNKKPEIVVRY